MFQNINSRCPECEFDAKKENNFEDHAIFQCYCASNYAQKTNLDTHIKQNQKRDQNVNRLDLNNSDNHNIIGKLSCSKCVYMKERNPSSVIEELLLRN